MLSRLRRLKEKLAVLLRTQQSLDAIRINQGRILAEMLGARDSRRLGDYEFTVFSQFGDDGILQHILRNVAIADKTFIEFGVEDYSESNTRFLMMTQRWSGLVIDSSPANVERLRASYFFWMHDLQAKCAFITRDNINELLGDRGFAQDLGILSVDIDGNDYWVLEAIRDFRPRILIVEYNAVFGAERAISVPYDAAFVRWRKHSSGLYWGASLPAFVHVARARGMTFVGTNTAGNNAYFVRDDLVSDRLPGVSIADGFSDSTWRDSRDEQGRLSFLSGNRRLEAIKGMPVVNVLTGAMEKL